MRVFCTNCSGTTQHTKTIDGLNERCGTCGTLRN